MRARSGGVCVGNMLRTCYFPCSVDRLNTSHSSFSIMHHTRLSFDSAPLPIVLSSHQPRSMPNHTSIRIYTSRSVRSVAPSFFHNPCFKLHASFTSHSACPHNLVQTPQPSVPPTFLSKYVSSHFHLPLSTSTRLVRLYPELNQF